MPRLILLSVLVVACARQPVEVVCVYPDEDQDQESATQDTSDTGEPVQEGPAPVTWDAAGNMPCDLLMANDSVLIDASSMADIEEYTVLWFAAGEPVPVGAESYEIDEAGDLRWLRRCDDDDQIFIMFNVRG